jgi:hypothetical protein
MRYFLRDGDETVRICAGRSETTTCGEQVFTDPKTGEQWTKFFYCCFGGPGPYWSGLARYPLPDADVLLAVCGDSEDLDEVAAASLFLGESVDTRWRCLDLVESLIEQSPNSPRVKVLLDNGVFEVPSGHCSSVGMMVAEINRQYELSMRCAERSVAIRKRLAPHSRPYDKPGLCHQGRRDGLPN